MSNAIFTDHGRARIAECLANNTNLTIDKLVFADVPDLNFEETPDAAFAYPTDHVVHTATPVAGLIDPQTAVFSTILTADMGDWHLNCMLLCENGNSPIAVAVFPRQKKVKTSGFQTGNTIVKNFAIEIKNVEEITGVTIPAEVWQVDFDKRYEPLGSVAKHNSAEDAHPGTFDAAGTGASEAKKAVDTHNKDSNAHPGTFDKAGTAKTEAASAVSAHDKNASAHSSLFAAKAAVSHKHAQSDITDLETTLAGKAASDHTHADLAKADASNVAGQAAAWLKALGLGAGGANGLITVHEKNEGNHLEQGYSMRFGDYLLQWGVTTKCDTNTKVTVTTTVDGTPKSEQKSGFLFSWPVSFAEEEIPVCLHTAEWRYTNTGEDTQLDGLCEVTSCLAIPTHTNCYFLLGRYDGTVNDSIAIHYFAFGKAASTE